MKKYNLEINEDEFDLIKLALSAASNAFRNKRVKYTPEELNNIMLDDDFEPFAEQKGAIRAFNSRLDELKNS